MKVAIIGGGAAGMFSAIQVKVNHPHAEVIVFEKSQKVLSKLKISGGGRCNVTNGIESIAELVKAYPRGGKKLKKLFPIFNNKTMQKWLLDRGVETLIQEDRCVFPVAQDSQVIIDCFLNEAKRLGVTIKFGAAVESIKQVDEKIKIYFADDRHSSQVFDKVIATTGGSPQRKGLDWLANLGHKIESPIPSLFTFNMPKESITKLMGIVVENAMTNIQGTKMKAEGPLLITHWGMSGPAILVLSSFGARYLSEQNYDFKVQINWVHEINNDRVKQELDKIVEEHPKKILANYRPYLLPERLWLYLVEKCELDEKKKWGDLSKKGVNKLINILTNDIYSVKGKTTFRDEFVTCGGVSLEDINFKTMQSKKVKNLYFAGEVLDIDAITGGYNFQGAWTTGFIAGRLGE
ncbi:NAD(P)/FAD-dependent oxidoreductase [Lentimicrobium sp. S6]|uniref:NAD(P)/FAD-dependent oxidoreductase n=1 Tax=Lentimicrobium sp. S6 TaxID=2735872 RepID=UPI001553BE42|nr:NAD(P)/FAD-dependent oxidoreductase [Lentimicrobium sp. S6]NPD44302.1 NAD(P)/FAD-dependent oxidoreductase [Lentimicrobium sp. S6]